MCHLNTANKRRQEAEAIGTSTGLQKDGEDDELASRPDTPGEQEGHLKQGWASSYFQGLREISLKDQEGAERRTVPLNDSLWLFTG